jgi:hypothetical protein
MLVKGFKEKATTYLHITVPTAQAGLTTLFGMEEVKPPHNHL